MELIHAEKSYAGPGIIEQTKSKTFMTGGTALRAQLPINKAASEMSASFAFQERQASIAKSRAGRFPGRDAESHQHRGYDEAGYEFCPAFAIRRFVFWRTLFRSIVLIRNFFLALIEKMPDAPHFLMKDRVCYAHVIGLQEIEERKRQSAIVFPLKELCGR